VLIAALIVAVQITGLLIGSAAGVHWWPPVIALNLVVFLVAGVTIGASWHNQPRQCRTFDTDRPRHRP
jgi:hypothetical protein